MSKKRIAVIALGYAWLPGEKGPSRFYYIADMLAKAGYDVELIGSGFQHFEKKPRNVVELKKKNYPFKNVFISVPAYRKNIDPRRIWSNWVASQNVYRYLEQQPDYDAVYCAIPPNNVAAAVSKYCKKKRIPFIVDIEDLWPEAMYMVFHVPVLSQLLYYPMYRDAERVYRNADAVVGTSEDYTERAFATRIKSIPAKTVYVGCDIDQFDNGAEIFLPKISKPKHEFWVSYAGSIGASYDIRTLVKAAAEIEREGHSDIRFKIMGTGPLLEDIKKLAAELSCTNVEILGYVEYPKMAAYLKKSDISLNSFVKGAPQSIVNKIGDYLSAGTAMINTLENPAFTSLVSREGFGVNIEPEKPEKMKEAVLSLYKDPQYIHELQRNARKCAENLFDRKQSYQEILSLVRQLI